MSEKLRKEIRTETTKICVGLWKETTALATWRSLVTLTRVVSIVNWCLGTWLKKVKGSTRDKSAEAVTLDSLIKKS